MITEHKEEAPTNKCNNCWQRIKNKVKEYIKNKYTNPPPLVAILNLHGIIASDTRMRNSLSLEDLEENIENAFNLPKVKAIALSINSPGGSPVQSELICNFIRYKATTKNVPVYSFAEDIAASGGYWLACAGDEIYASESSIIGSVGVLSRGFGFHEAINKLGIERRIYTQGKNKSLLDPFSPEKDSDVQILKEAQKDVHESFKTLIRTRRQNKLQSSEEELFNGEFWSGKKALSHGLIDGIGDLYSIMREKYGSEVKFKRIGKTKSWLKKKLGINHLLADCIDISIGKFVEFSMWNKFGL